MTRWQIIRIVVSFTLVIGGLFALVEIPDQWEKGRPMINSIFERITAANAQWVMVVMLVGSMAVVWIPWWRLFPKVRIAGQSFFRVDSPTAKTLIDCAEDVPTDGQGFERWFEVAQAIVRAAFDGNVARHQFSAPVKSSPQNYQADVAKSILVGLAARKEEEFQHSRPSNTVKSAVIDTSSFRWVNQGSAQATISHSGRMVLECKQESHGPRLFVSPISGPSFQFTCQIIPNCSGNRSLCGVAIYSIVDRKSIVLCLKNNSELQAQQYADEHYVLSRRVGPYKMAGCPIWLKVESSVFGQSFLVSQDGEHFICLLHNKIGNFLSSCDSVGFFLQTVDDSSIAAMTVLKAEIKQIAAFSEESAHPPASESN